MSLWAWLWVIWGLSFVVIETVAIIRDKREDEDRTLSDHLREWFRTDTKRGRTVWLIVSGIFFAWFVTHIAIKGDLFGW